VPDDAATGPTGLVVSLKTAKALGSDLSQSLIVRADETIDEVSVMRSSSLLFALSVLASAFGATAQSAAQGAAQDCAPERAAMVETIRNHVRSDPSVLDPAGLSDRVMDVMGRTLRHRFIPDGSCATGYADRPASIGHRSTISQPYIVALMTELAAAPADGVALEIGTGSGYQAAILAQLTRKVCTVEIVQPLAVTSALVLRQLGYDNVSVRIGDGYLGWPECGPFDAIIVTAALGEVPQPLIEQLKVGGKLVMPVGPAGAIQILTVVEKIAPDKVTTRAVTPVRFVPFLRSK
jgi:protein-L-isoaspartate(D-aspartate) O-methyltransferase